MGRKPAPRVIPYPCADGSTSYRVRIRVNGRQSTETFASEAAAKVFALRVADPNIGAARAVQMRDREDKASSDYVPTLAEMLDKHVSDLTGVEDETREEYRRVAARTWLPMLGGFRVDELTHTDIARWVNAIDGTIAPKSIRNAHSVLSATLRTAVRDRHITGNPAQGTRLPRTGSDEEEDVKFLTHAEFDLLYREIPAEYQPLVAWQFGMGTRFGEATAVQVRDINLDAGQYDGDVWNPYPEVRIRRAWKKGNNLGVPKSEASNRTVVFATEVVEVIRPLLEDRRPTDFLFTTATGKPVRHNNFFNRIWKPATLRASICEQHREERCRCLTPKPTLCPVHHDRTVKGHQVLPEPCGCRGTIPFRPNIHAARHTHASWLIEQGIRLDVVQHRLGHEDYLTTMRLYGHLMPDARVMAGAAASGAFARTSLARGDFLALSPPT